MLWFRIGKYHNHVWGMRQQLYNIIETWGEVAEQMLYFHTLSQ